MRYRLVELLGHDRGQCDAIHGVGPQARRCTNGAQCSVLMHVLNEIFVRHVCLLHADDASYAMLDGVYRLDLIEESPHGR